MADDDHFETDCIICHNVCISAQVMQCGHAVCIICSPQISKCPYCRVIVGDKRTRCFMLDSQIEKKRPDDYKKRRIQYESEHTIVGFLKSLPMKVEISKCNEAPFTLRFLKSFFTNVKDWNNCVSILDHNDKYAKGDIWCISFEKGKCDYIYPICYNNSRLFITRDDGSILVVSFFTKGKSVDLKR